MAAGQAKKQTKYIYQTDDMTFNREFYETYDDTFLIRKAKTLWLIANNREPFQEFASTVQGAEAKLDDAYFAGLRAEIHFTELHQMEAFFALLFAPFQELPHRLYLNHYRPGDIPELVDMYLKGSISRVTERRCRTEREFVQLAVYAGYAVYGDDEESKLRWEENLDKVSWILHRLGRKYLTAPEYNAYKHGLRVLARGQGFIRIRLTDSTGPGITRVSEDSLRFLDIKKQDSGERVVMDTFKLFTLDECVLNLHLMERLLATMKATRLGQLTQNETPTIQVFHDVDRNELAAMMVNNTALSTSF